MCILSFVPNGKNWIITMILADNDKVQINPPKPFTENSGKIYYARNPSLEGSWLMLHEKGWIGAILSTDKLKLDTDPVIHKIHYKLLNQILRNNEPIILLKSLKLEPLPPFQLILFINNNLYEFNWDGNELIEKFLSNNEVYFWEAPSYFSNDWLQLRHQQFLQQVANPSFEISEFVLALQRRLGEQKDEQLKSLIAQKKSIVNIAPDIHHLKHINLTQVIVSENIIRFYYYDFINPQYLTQTIVKQKQQFW